MGQRFGYNDSELEFLVVVLFSLLAFLIASIFFALIPGFGAFQVRAKWRSFRSRMIEASTLPFVDYSDLRVENVGQLYRFFGNLEAFQGKNKIWIRIGNFSIAADLEDVPVFILPSMSFGGNNGEALPDEQPQIIPWKQISSLPAGVQIFVSGALFMENGRAIFRSHSKYSLLVVIYDGSKNSILNRATWCGRQKNEFWNQFTPISLITGSFSLLFLAYVFLTTTPIRLLIHLSLALSFAPLASLLPPGVIFLFLYRKYWKKARILRAERDIHRLPLRYLSPDNKDKVTAGLPDGEQYKMFHGSMSDVKTWLPEAVNIKPIPLSIPPVGDEIFIFGSFDEQNRVLTVPADPMAELVMIRGNPEENALKCSKWSRLYTLLSGLFLALDIVPNLFLILISLRFIIKL